MLSRFFINRPIFATVLSILIVVAGVITLRSLPVEQYPTITPPTVVVEAQYPGANATTIAQTHGGGGGSPGSGWGKRPDEDDREWARRCLAMARKMCAPSVRKRKKM